MSLAAFLVGLVLIIFAGFSSSVELGCFALGVIMCVLAVASVEVADDGERKD